MKFEVKQPVEFEVAVLRLSVAVRHEDEIIPYDFPGRNGDVWQVDINVDTGQIKDWPGPAFDMCMKVVDSGSYYLLDSDGNVVSELEGDYVPSDCGIGGGDYIEMKWDENGFIEGWTQPNLRDFADEY